MKKCVKEEAVQVQHQNIRKKILNKNQTVGVKCVKGL